MYVLFEGKRNSLFLLFSQLLTSTEINKRESSFLQNITATIFVVCYHFDGTKYTFSTRIDTALTEI